MQTTFLIADRQASLRPVQPEDEAFLYEVYASTRADEMALVDWTEAQKTAFLRQQFTAQTEHYRRHYLQAEYQIIQLEERPIGRLIIERTETSLLIMDLTLLPEYRNAGLGAALLKEAQIEAQQSGVPVVVRVEFFNPAIRLYARMGFVKTREINTVYHEMVWSPAT